MKNCIERTEMSDIVSRAMDRPYLHDNDDAAVWSKLIDEMADEIERLEAKIKADAWVKPKLMEYKNEIERLEALLTEQKYLVSVLQSQLKDNLK